MLPELLVAGTGAVRFATGVVRVGPVELEVRLGEVGSGVRLDWSVRNPGRRAVRLTGFGCALRGRFDRVLEHGWQSWSSVRRCSPGDVRPERRRVPRWRRAMYFAEPRRAGRVVAGEPFLLTDGGLVGFLDGRRHLSTVEVDGDAGLTALASLDGVLLAPRQERALEPLWWAGGDPGSLYAEYAELWGAEAGARTDAVRPLGWCSWYHYYSSVEPRHVRANLALARRHGLELVQVDDGYQAAVGEWLSPRPLWAEGTAAVAADISAAGLQPGIWTAPFLVDERSRLLAEHPDWAVADGQGRPLRAMHNPRWWGGWAVALDTTHPEVLEHLRATFSALAEQGFSYHKIDFGYAAALAGRRHDPGATRAQALRLGLDAVRSALGENAFLLACGCPFAPAVGVVDAMRVSPDVAPRWLPRRVEPGLEEAASCARNSLATSLLRSPLHRRLWVNDDDCLLLRPTETQLDPEQRRMLAAAVAAKGTSAIVSDDLALYGFEEWELLERVRTAAPSQRAPVLDDPFADAPRLRDDQRQRRQPDSRG